MGVLGISVFKEVRIGLIDKMVIKKRLVGCEGFSRVNIWRKRIWETTSTNTLRWNPASRN